jgi:hypothetical protein
MARLHVQFQPRRASKLPLATVAGVMLTVALSKHVRDFSITRGRLNEYVNFDFKTSDVSALWRKLKKSVLGHRRYGKQIRSSVIIARTGSRGWNNYKLLHHFDPSVTVDD